MMRLTKVLLLGVAGLAAAGAAVATVAYEPAAQSLFSKLVSERNVRVERGAKYGIHERHALDIYHPPGGGQSGPVALFLYGGSWRYGHRSVYGFVGAALAARGITAVVADYRIYPEVKFPDFVDDAAQAYRWVSEHLTAADGASRPIVLIGHSAGAHIAALLAYNREYLASAGGNPASPYAFVGLSGPYAFDPTTWESTAEIFSTAPTADSARPVSFVRPGAPPSLLMHGLGDDLVKVWNTRTLAEALERNGTTVRRVEFTDVGHLGIILAVSQPFRWRAPVLDEMVAFVNGLDEPRRLAASASTRP